MTDLITKKFGLLTVIAYAGKPGLKHRWLCKCDCGNTSDIQENHLKSGNTKSCGCLHRRNGKDSPMFRGYGEIPLDFFTIIHRGAITRNHGFFITIKYLWELFLKQDKKCALSNLPLSFGNTAKSSKNSKTSKKTASLDRIDSSKGYVEGNVQWVHKDINMMKGTLDTDRFLYYCNHINENQHKRN